ncbi:MAG: PD-(D/E)XK nuclease family protein, partial [Planctomycetota bacterium]
MSELAKHLPEESPVVEAIYAAYKRRGDSEQPRGYLGASIIGHSCGRYLWYVFRYCCKPNFSGRMYRLFSTGDHEEARFIADLRAIGCEVHETDPNTGKQFEVNALGGHFSGHMDGCVLGVPTAEKTWHVCEFKTHNDKSFKQLRKEGVQATKPQHWAQMQVYMHLTGMSRALYLAVNKDTDELHAERVRYDRDGAEALIEKARRIITDPVPPERIATRQDYFECRWCDANTICWGGASTGPALPIPEVNCRQCCHATPAMDGNARWVCERHKRSLSPSDQSRACGDHLVLPGLLESHSAPADYSDDGIQFALNAAAAAGEERWKHGKGGFTTQELMKLPPSALVNPTLAAAKEHFGAFIADFSPEDILAR